MATSTKKKVIGGTITRKGQDTAIEQYEVQYDSVPTNIFDALAIAQGLTPDPVPSRFARYPNSGLYVDSITPKVTEESRSVWQWDVNYASLEQGEDNSQQVGNPLSRPPVYNLEFIESDERITTAKNVERLGSAAGGSARAANTDGPIVNAAGEQPDEALVRPVRNPVLVTTVNKASLSSIVALNESYENTTNSGGILGFSTRRLQFHSATSSGRQEVEGQVYYPCTIYIEVKKTTDLVLDNVGWHHWETVDDPDNPGTDIWALVRAQVEVVNSAGGAIKADAAAPVNLTIGGAKGTDQDPISITYRHLAETSYTNLINYGT